MDLRKINPKNVAQLSTYVKVHGIATMTLTSLGQRFFKRLGLLQKLKAEVDSLLRQAEQADQSAIPDGMSIPEELERREKRLEAIAKAKLEIERRAEERYAKEQAEHEEKLAERERKAQERGKKSRGKIPKAPEPGVRRLI